MKRSLFLGLPIIFLFCNSVYAEEKIYNLPEIKQGTPPEVTAMYPCYLSGPNTTDLSKVSIEFSKPVEGVQAGNLIVNGSPATQLAGEGKGVYTFLGFIYPSFGEVQIDFSSGEIKDSKMKIPFEGKFWVCHFFDPLGDEDKDGLTNAQEINDVHTDPTNADTDNDGMPDKFETDNRCLDPVGDQAHPLGYTRDPLPGNNDADDDGVSDLEEFKQGTDPCVP